MARVPGTETQHNRAGLRPGQVVRFRRSRANGERGLADRRGFVTDVRPGAACVLLDTRGASLWIESGSLLPETDLGGGPEQAGLDLLRRAFISLAGLRLEPAEGEWTVFTASVPVLALDEVRALLGPRLQGLEIAAHGVHELAVRLALQAGD